MTVSLQENDFDIATEIDALSSGDTGIGAVVTFTGLVRDMVDDERIIDMTLEHYPAMARTELERIEAEANKRWPLNGTRIIHRFGTLIPGDRIVLVVTASSHRQAAFEAAEFIMDFLKTRAPFWKKEKLEQGDSGWVEAKDKDDAALERWKR
ncbi:molybdenum cofactor biosynthesis protein MoaE [Cohaesibacter gelatinilyticus]|uniref:Molybdopterin synthase catalytic subunit n=1 Tax=Cohaesibacter gelatinilyticus TaxID=372072 RepID=A0A285PL91_9HYPH|nr:molybdenum cofactor biosynthesis protein MoaE [Cohaesibacter gelatinilyticus]SNZ20866.1 molybdopterin synthase subunit MoaE [Cohaesibacter gelatinilyticus]HAT87165.1 molybdenum cofactor biosynthesis protein MoaE [Hyphomicrobiales bacterium]